MKHAFKRSIVFISALPALLLCAPAFADIQGMFGNLQSAILGILAPAVCICGVVFHGFRLAMGDESAKMGLFWSCVGAVFAFSAPSILSFLQYRVAS